MIINTKSGLWLAFYCCKIKPIYATLLYYSLAANHQLQIDTVIFKFINNVNREYFGLEQLIMCCSNRMLSQLTCLMFFKSTNLHIGSWIKPIYKESSILATYLCSWNRPKFICHSIRSSCNFYRIPPTSRNRETLWCSRNQVTYQCWLIPETYVFSWNRGNIRLEQHNIVNGSWFEYLLVIIIIVWRPCVD